MMLGFWDDRKFVEKLGGTVVQQGNPEDLDLQDVSIPPGPVKPAKGC
jgi:hypothetical protein